MDVVLFWENHV